MEALEVGFGLRRSRGALYQALARLAGKVAPTYEGLVQAARQSLVDRVDETGWRVGGVPWYLWTFVSDEVTVYAILPGRGFEEAASVLGADYRGWLVHDGWAPYYRFVRAYHQTCLEHLIRRSRVMAEVAKPAAACFPWPSMRCCSLGHTRPLRAEPDQRVRTVHRDRTVGYVRLDRLLARQYRAEANRRLAKHLRLPERNG